MSSKTRPPHEEAHESGAGLSPELRELLAAERTPPELPRGLEGRLWARLEGGLLPVPVPRAEVGLLGKPWALAAGVIGVAGLVIGVYFAVAGSGPTPEVAAVARGAIPDPASDLEPVGRPAPSVLATGPKTDSGGPGLPAEGRSEPGAAPGVIGHSEGAPPESGAAHPEASVRQPAPVEGDGADDGDTGHPVEAAIVHEAARVEGVRAPRPRKDVARTKDPVAERALLTRARAALRDRALSEAFASLAEHQRIFPRGELAEEREALRVHALAAEQRTDEARRARSRFVARFPNSIHTPGLNALDL